ncbi:MAG: alpha/beta fold hydrolase [Rhodospirillaceae bacterium]
MAFAERTYSAGDGLGLYYRDYAPEPGVPGKIPVLCLPGLTRNSKDFHVPAERLQKIGHRVICPDYRGRGRSAYDPNPDNYRMETYVSDVRHLLCALNLHRVAVIGTSMGGILAMAMAAAIPTYLAGVVLNDIGWIVPAKGVEPIIQSLKYEKVFASWVEARDALRRGFPDLPADTDDEWMELTQATFIEGQDGGIHRDWDGRIVIPIEKLPPGDTDLRIYFRALANIPTGVVRGAKSHILTPAILSDMAAAREDLIHATVTGVGHPPNLKEQLAKEVIDAVLARI